MMSDQYKNLGKKAFVKTKGGQIMKGTVEAYRVTKHLNTGSPLHGKTLPAEVEYYVRNSEGSVWRMEENVVFNPEKVHTLV